jgi:hypothetical protein
MCLQGRKEMTDRKPSEERVPFKRSAFALGKALIVGLAVVGLCLSGVWAILAASIWLLGRPIPASISGGLLGFCAVVGAIFAHRTYDRSLAAQNASNPDESAKS